MSGILLLLGLAMASALLVQYLHVPYTVVLVAIGFGLGVAGVTVGFDLDRDLILHVFLPLLLFEGALHVDLDLLRASWLPIALLAIPGVVISTLLIGAGLHAAIGISLASAALLGAALSATDPVAVLATFKRMKLPPRLAMIVEGESVLNDGTALVLFTLLLPAAQGLPFDAPITVLKFAGVLVGGAAIGTVLGLLAARAATLFEDHLAALTLSVLLAYGSFLLAERVAVSGVIATVAAGMVFIRHSERWHGPEPAEVLHDVWGFAAFLANSLLFLLLGLKVSAGSLRDVAGELAWAILFTLLARAVIVYGFGLLLRWRRRPFLWNTGHLVFWSGLRGALAIALALSLPAGLVQRGLLVQLTAGVILFTLLAQGLTIGPLLERLRGGIEWQA